MRTLHLLHIIVLFILFGFDLYYIRQYRLAVARMELLGIESSSYGVPSFEYGIISLIVFVCTTALGIWTRKRLPKTGNLLLLGGTGYSLWSCIMIASPRHISVQEIFPAWCIWIVLAIVLSGIGYLRADNVIEQFYDDDILDDKLD